MSKVRAIRGATTADENTKDAIVDATREMLESLVEENDFELDDVISAFFTTTKDLNAQFPAVAARKIGWVDENNLSQTIFNNLKKINKGEVTDVIQIGNNYLLLKIEEIKKTEISINKKVELEKMIKFESNKQLNQYSRIFFNIP